MSQRLRDRLDGALPHDITFLVTVIRGAGARRRRLAAERDRGGISVETAIIIMGLIALATAIVIAIKALGTRYAEKLDGQ